MQLASIVALKGELLTGFELLPPPRVVARTRRLEFTPAGTRSATLALGVAAGRTNHDYSLGVRIVMANSTQSQRLADEIRKRTHGECDVRIVPRVSAQARWRPSSTWFRRRRRPLMPGLSIGHVNAEMAGTLGAIVEDDAAYYLLSNNHVIADVNRSRKGDPIIQQGRLDLGRKPHVDDIVATLTRFKPISFARRNYVDVAAAKIEHDVEFWSGWNPAIDARLTGARRLTEDDVNSRLEVVKVGRTTGLTRGRVTMVALDGLDVDMGDSGVPQYARFYDQVEIIGIRRPFSDAGDSGSLIVDARSQKAVALLFAGGLDTAGRSSTYANPLDRVLSSLGVQLTV